VKIQTTIAALALTMLAGAASAGELWTSIPVEGPIRFMSSDIGLVSYDCAASDCGNAPCGSSYYTKYKASTTRVGCGPIGCGGVGCGGCGYGPHCSGIDHSGTWLAFDFLLWQVSGYGVQPLVTSSPVGTPRPAAGVLPGATILYGNETLEDDIRPGGRLRFGYWYDDFRTYGFEGSFAALGQESSNFAASSDGSTGSLGRPFFNEDPNINGQDALIIGFDEPGPADAFTGSTAVTTSSNVYNGHFAYRRLWRQCGSHRVDLTFGYRFFRLNEGLRINDDITVDGAAGGIVGTNFQIEDLFETKSEFHGAELGLVSTYDHGYWTTEFIAKLALGNSRQEVMIDGSTVTTIGGVPFTAEGGLLAQPTNIGHYRTDQFAVIPELNANFSYRATPNLKLTAGYTMIFVSDVIRPGDVLDYNVNGTQLGGALNGPATPAFDFDSSGLWVYGLNLGAQWNY